VPGFLAARGYEEVRRYVVSELDVAGAPAPGRPAHDVVSLAERPDLAEALYAIALEAYRDQPGRDGATWWHGFTGVARARRGRGVAGSLKRAQIAWAERHGVPALRTATETRLTHMRSLDDRFGYRPLYEEVVLRGPLASAVV
jgi:GNAT superfamily N-acetyltransferase